MNKMLKKVIAIAVIATVALNSLTVFGASSLGPAPSTVAGTGTVLSPVYNVLLPTSLVITVNPFNLNEQPEVFSQNYAVVNRSNVPVVVAARFVPRTGNTDATRAVFVDDAAKVIPSEPEQIAARNVYLNLKFGKGLEGDGQSIAHNMAVTAMSGLEIEYNPEAYIYLNDFIEGALATSGANAADHAERGHTVYFLLDAHDYTYNPATNAATIVAEPVEEKSYAFFSFGGQINPNASWAASQVMVTTVFTITGQSATVFEDLADEYDAIHDDALNAYEEKSA